MTTFTETITEPLTEPDTHNSLWEQGAWNREHGTREDPGFSPHPSSLCEGETKHCRGCDRTLPLTEFYPCRRNGYQHRCKDCKRAYNAANAEHISKRHRNYLRSRPGWKPAPEPNPIPARFRQYGITQADYDQMRIDQDHRCAICRRHEDERPLVIDHDHDTGVVRGLLCSPCNTGIGMLGDGPETVAAALAYLEPATMDDRCAVIR